MQIEEHLQNSWAQSIKVIKCVQLVAGNQLSNSVNTTPHQIPIKVVLSGHSAFAFCAPETGCDDSYLSPKAALKRAFSIVLGECIAINRVTNVPRCWLAAENL